MREDKSPSAGARVGVGGVPAPWTAPASSEPRKNTKLQALGHGGLHVISISLSVSSKWRSRKWRPRVLTTEWLGSLYREIFFLSYKGVSVFSRLQSVTGTAAAAPVHMLPVRDEQRVLGR